MARYLNLAAEPAPTHAMRRWLLLALAASLLLHLGLLIFFRFHRLENFSFTPAERLAPPPIVLKFVLADLQSDEAKPLAPKAAEPPRPILIPQSIPQAPEQFMVKPDAQAQTAPLVPEDVRRPDASGFGQLGHSGKSLEDLWSGLSDSLVAPDLASPNQPVLHSGAGEGTAGASASSEIPGRLSVQNALQNVGGPIVGQPIAMQGGALFEWGKSDLRPEAVAGLQRLGELLKRYPRATFLISGHTDHTGTHEANLLLSQQRADAVRDWLVANLGLDPERITAVGKADDEAFPNLGSDKSIDEQAANRRVEIVIQTHGG